MKTVIFLVVFISIVNCWSVEKDGYCSRHVKRSVCQCYPQGNDDCNDLCDNDNDCQGRRKCCSDGCKRRCKLPSLRSSTPRCTNEDEEYHSCYQGCDRTCSNPTGAGCESSQCRTGCFCRSDLVRNDFGQCVDKSQCQSQSQSQTGCGDNEHFEECSTSCPNTCPQTTNCQNNGCQQGCVCDRGFVRNVTDGNCISATQCRNRGGQRGGCRFGEESVPCGNNCQRGCQNGYSSYSCNSSCRQRCCRRRLF